MSCQLVICLCNWYIYKPNLKYAVMLSPAYKMRISHMSQVLVIHFSRDLYVECILLGRIWRYISSKIQEIYSAAQKKKRNCSTNNLFIKSPLWIGNVPMKNTVCFVLWCQWKLFISMHIRTVQDEKAVSRRNGCLFEETCNKRNDFD